LKQVFKNKFIPLLQEYFFGDYSRLGLVLGEGFFEPSDNDGQIFAKFREVDDSDFENREIYRLRNMDSMSDREFEEALNGMMQS
jgi:5-methylcytosine-specific restriction protein B